MKGFLIGFFGTWITAILIVLFVCFISWDIEIIINIYTDFILIRVFLVIGIIFGISNIKINQPNNEKRIKQNE